MKQLQVHFMPSGRFTKTHSFCTKKWKLEFYEAKPETLFGRVFCNDKVHTLGMFGCFITLYARFLPSTQSLGWKSQVKPYLIVLPVNTFGKKASILQDGYFT
jgi:hypothetical protein